MKIVADQNIPQVYEAFSDLGEVELLPGRSIERKHLLDCQCLLVRTVTQIDCRLLDDTAVEFVGTATVGTDHVDLNYLEQNQISFSNAAGCNAEGVSEYVINGLFALSEHKGFDPFELKAGIIGCGNIGSRLLQKLQALGIDTLINDPPLEEIGTPGYHFVDLDTILSESNFITLHVPLTNDGDHPTWHLFDQQCLQRLNRNCILVNTARGPVVNNVALLDLLERRSDLTVFLDTWENEPDISRALLQQVDLATPHVAGYSVEGRLRATQMILDATCRHFSVKSKWRLSQKLPKTIDLRIEASDNQLRFWQRLFAQHYDIWQDHLALTHSHDMNDVEFSRHFESLRKVYPNRFEYERYRLPVRVNKKAAAMARGLLFQ
ncbi:MAG: 4-phosphoerythronate dehydrogenase [Gammaproteobacteria bacterium]|nr:4-phosphoerythronate dehydrogenase [Gammaproteobacteria bacterium]